MPDEVVTPTEVVVEPTSVVTPEVTPEVTPDVHPLEPGGKRFTEVYAEMQDARREAQAMRERVARLEGQQSVTQQQAQPKQEFYTAEQLQGYVDAGKISPAKMADQLAWQRAELKGREMVQQQHVMARHQTALNEVNQYIAKMPALMNQGSPEFATVARAAREVAEDMGLSVDNPVVQRRALREAFGSIDKVAKQTQAREVARQGSDTFTETSGGGGGDTDTTAAKNPLKGVPQHYLDHWKRVGYTHQQMVDEAKYIKPRRTR